MSYIERYLFDRDGNPMSYFDWEAVRMAPYRFIAVWDRYDFRVSTIWLGFDFNLAERPEDRAIFETMIRDPHGEYVYQDRYATEEQAREGHAAAVARVEELRQKPEYQVEE